MTAPTRTDARLLGLLILALAIDAKRKRRVSPGDLLDGWKGKARRYSALLADALEATFLRPICA
jgi:hypothetical protein